MKDIKSILLKLMTMEGLFSIELESGIVYKGCTILGLKTKISNVDPRQSFIDIETAIGRVNISPYDIKSIYN